LTTPNQVFVDALRAALGLQPLYSGQYAETCGTYLSREQLQKLASPDCTRCGGSGYYDEWLLDARCPCTGLPQRCTRAKRQRDKSANPSFGSVRSLG